MRRRDRDEWFLQLGGDFVKHGDELGAHRPMVAHKQAWEPRVDLFEEDRRFVLVAELAGINGDAIELEYRRESHSVTIRGTRPEETGNGVHKTGVYQLEILYGPFEREIKLPEAAIESEDIRAQYRNGLLVVTIPKRERSTKKIALNID